MKRYLVFRYDKYYPCGGFHDFLSAHETLEDAIEELNNHTDGYFEYGHILDIQKLERVYSKD